MTLSTRHRSRVQKAFQPTADNLGKRVVGGAAFTIVGVAVRTAITIGSMAVLARLLTPTDFGHLAMATVITELAAIFSNFGFGAILVQRLRITRVQMDTMHWCAVALGASLTTLIFGLSFAADHLFHDPTVGPLLRVLCFSFILEELAMVPRSLLARRMMFKEEFAVQSTAMLARAATAVLFAMHDFGVMSLAFGAMIGFLVQAFAYQYLAGYWPRPRFSRVFLRSTWRTNSGYFGNGILFYINNNLDFFLVGRMLGAAPLGQYQNARSLTDEVRVRMAQPLQRVLFPAFAAIQDDLPRFSASILRSGRVLSLLFVPAGFGLAAVAPELVLVLYGDQWLPMIPILQLLAVSTGFSAAASISNPIFNATNRIGLSFQLYCAWTVLSVLFILVGSYWGLLGIAWSRLAMTAVNVVFLQISFRLVRLGWKHVWQVMGMPCLASIVMCLVLLQARELLARTSMATAAMLITLIAAGAAVYILLVLLTSPTHVRDARDVLSKFRRKA